MKKEDGIDEEGGQNCENKTKEPLKAFVPYHLPIHYVVSSFFFLSFFFLYTPRSLYTTFEGFKSYIQLFSDAEVFYATGLLRGRRLTVVL